MLLFLLCVFGCFAGGGRVDASSATISVETKNNKVAEGDNYSALHQGNQGI